MKRRFEALWLPILLIVFAAAAYGPALNLPFVGDDYVFLGETRNAAFQDLWSFRNVAFQWYRPWSREPIGCSASCCGSRQFVSMPRSCAGTHRLEQPRSRRWVSQASPCGAHPSCGSREVRISGCCVSLWRASYSSSWVVHAGRFCRSAWRCSALRDTAHFWGMLLVWLAIHPTLQARLLADHHGMAEGVRRSPTLEILAKTILSSLNLESIPRPQELNGVKVAQVLVSSAALGLGTVVAARKRQSDRRTGSDDPGRRNLARFAMLWMVVGWFPLFLPSIDWHA